MAHNVGLRIVLTVYGFFDVIAPTVLSQQIPGTWVTKSLNAALLRYSSTTPRRRDELLKRLRHTQTRAWLLFRDLKYRVTDFLFTPKRPLLDLPGELREEVYKAVCAQDDRGAVGHGVLHILLINKQIYREAKPIFDQIEHRVQIGDLDKFSNNDSRYWGYPQTIIPKAPEEVFTWDISNLKHLVLDVGICGIGEMTPDRFDVILSHNAKEQWRNLKKLIGIWPEIREIPLESVRLDLKLSRYPSGEKLYRADLIRVIRNFKRTKVWAETGNCSGGKSNTSKLLPLVRAFNQGRRNWVEESDIDNNLIVRYDQHVLSKRAVETDEKGKEVFETELEKWSVVPKNDTSRSDNSVWPEWTGKEEKYIHDKMIARQRDRDDEWECQECLAVFDTPGDLRSHCARGQWR